MNGWVKTFRKLKAWQWYKKRDMVHLFIHLLLSANHKDGTWMNHEVKRGQVITGRKQLSYETGISERAIRTIINRLISTSEITIKTTNKYSIVTICNYDSYQGNGIENDQQNDQQEFENRPTKSEKTTTNNKSINNKEDSLYKILIDRYYNWFKDMNDGIIPKMDGANGKAMKSIIVYLQNVLKAKNNGSIIAPEIADEKILGMWNFILENWGKLDNFQQDKTRLIDINSNIQNIIKQLKDGRVKKNRRGASFDDIERIVDGTIPRG